MEYRVPTREELQTLKPGEAWLPLPELGPDCAMRVKGYDRAETLQIDEASTNIGQDGAIQFSGSNNSIWAVCLALIEPRLDPIRDGEVILKMPNRTVQKIINKALELSGKSESGYEQLKTSLRENDYERRIYALCAKMGRFPAELGSIPESEFVKMLAVAELEAEDEAEAREKATQE